MIVCTARGKIREGNVLPTAQSCGNHHFLIDNLTLKTNDCLIECYVHEIEGLYFRKLITIS